MCIFPKSNRKQLQEHESEDFCTTPCDSPLGNDPEWTVLSGNVPKWGQYPGVFAGNTKALRGTRLRPGKLEETPSAKGLQWGSLELGSSRPIVCGVSCLVHLKGRV